MAFGSSVNQRTSDRPAVKFGGFGTGADAAPIEYLDPTSYDDFLQAVEEADQTKGVSEPWRRIAELENTTTTNIREVAAVCFPDKVRCQNALINSVDGFQNRELEVPLQSHIDEAREFRNQVFLTAAED